MKGAKKGAHPARRQTKTQAAKQADLENAAHDWVIQRYSGVGKPDAFIRDHVDI